MLEKAVAYVDGSYNSSTGRYGYGVVFIGRDGRQVFSGSGYDVYGGRQIPGETEAALTACQAALEGGYPAIDIYYDYEGIAAWSVGYWEAKKDYTARYADKMRDYMGKMQVRFFHAKAHTGIRGNEEADTLAKDACGMGPAKRESGGGYRPMVPEGVNSKCGAAIRNFYRKENPSFRDFMNLKVFGRDCFSSMDKEALSEAILKKENLEAFQDVPEEAFCNAIRWCLRGLCPEDAIHKAMVDLEIAGNCTGRFKQ